MAIDLTREGREALKSIEDQKKIQTLSNMMIGMGTGLAAYGGFNKKLLPSLAGLATAGGAGILSGRAKRKENRAMTKLRRYHNLKEGPRLINLSAMIPDREKIAEAVKEAIIGSAGHAIVTGNLLPLVADAAFIPAAARWAGGSTRKALHVAAKQELGRPLAPGEKMRAAVINAASAIKDTAHKVKIPGVRGAVDYATSYLGPYATAAKAGPVLGKTLREVEKVSPRYADLLIEAIPGGDGQKRLIDTMRQDKDKFQKALEILEGTRVGRFAKGTSSSGGAFLGRYLQDPGKAIHDAKRLKDVEDNIVRAGQFAAGAGLVAGAGHLAGRFKEEKTASFWGGFQKAAQR